MMTLQDIESVGRLVGFAVGMVVAAGGIIWKLRQHSDEIERLRDKVFSEEPGKKLITLEWHDRIQTECERQRGRDLQILAGHIVEQIRPELADLRDELARVATVVKMREQERP